MSARAKLLMGLSALLVFAAGWMLRGSWPQMRTPAAATRPSSSAPLPGKNTVSALEVKQSQPGRWTADFDYFFTGQPYSASLSIDLTPQEASAGQMLAPPNTQTELPSPQRGAHHVTFPIAYPGGALQTLQVKAVMRDQMFGKQVLASQQVDQVIDWPDFQTWAMDQEIANSSPQQNLDRAVGLINSDSSDGMASAKAILEQLIQANPRFDAGYIQLARIAMRTDWGPDGLRQAKDLLATALRISPDSADARILLGYVYAHQRDFKRAEMLFEEVARTPVRNPWLWSNWGELDEMRHQPEQAMSEYRRAIAQPVAHDDNDRGRLFAYDHMLQLLKARNDLDGMEVLYKKRLNDFGPGSCYSTDYARFLLQVRGKVQAAIDLAKGALNQSCNDAPARQMLGLAEYVKWSQTVGQESAHALDTARIYLPAGPQALYLLAESDRTVVAARKLIDSGESIDERDNDNLTALAYALQNQEPAAARRLLSLGARTDVTVGYAQVPVALLPVLLGDSEGVRLMQRHGVDYMRLRYRGATGYDLAQRLGNAQVLKVLGAQKSEL